jgi:hypothetical protein
MAVEQVPALRVRRIDIDGLLEAAGDVDRAGLRKAWTDLLAWRRWAALSDILRYLFLWIDGGVYLDLDILALRDLRPLLDQRAFLGREYHLVNGAVWRQDSRLRYFRTVPLTALRWVLAHVDWGVAGFQAVEGWYLKSVNGAILATEKGHPLARELMQAVPPLYPEIPRRMPAIGPDLLQDFLHGRDRPDVTIYPPEYFYPIGPTMAEQYFRRQGDVEAVKRRIVGKDTYIVHWYNNCTSTNIPASPEQVRALAGVQVFSALAAPLVD